MAKPIEDDDSHELLPVLPLRDICLFPEASLSCTVARPATLQALEIAARAGRIVLAVTQRDSLAAPNPRDLQAVGTIARIVEDRAADDDTHQVELDGLTRARVISLVGVDTLIAEVERLREGDPGSDWGPAVEALARYMHAHPDLRQFLDKQRRSAEAMSWVNLACQHLPIAASARQKLLESDARERCIRIGRGLDALLRKEQGS